MPRNIPEIADLQLDAVVIDLILWLDDLCTRGEYKPNHKVRRTKRFLAIDSDFGTVCFISKTDQSTKGIGPMKCGDFLKPRGDHYPVKTVRGNIFNREDWERLFDRNGMKGLKSVPGKRKPKNQQ